MRISDWSSDVCSSDLVGNVLRHENEVGDDDRFGLLVAGTDQIGEQGFAVGIHAASNSIMTLADCGVAATPNASTTRSEEHTSELQSLMSTSYAIFCWKKTTIN